MDLEIAKFALQVVNLAGTGAVALYMYLVNRNRVTNERITALEDKVDARIDDHADRLARIETAAGRAPSHEDIGKLYERVNALSGTVSELKGVLTGVSDTLRLILSRVTERGM